MRNNLWHYQHLMDPRSMSPGSNMPTYAHLAEKKFDQKTLPRKVAVMTQLGVPYPPMDGASIKIKALEQGGEIMKNLHESGVQVRPDSEMVALIAYLQKLGSYDLVEQKLPAPSGAPLPGKPVNPDRARDALHPAASN